MPAERDCPFVFIENRIPDTGDGFLGNPKLDRGGGFEHDLKLVSPFFVCFEHFGADASDGEPIDDLGDIGLVVGGGEDEIWIGHG